MSYITQNPTNNAAIRSDVFLILLLPARYYPPKLLPYCRIVTIPTTLIPLSLSRSGIRVGRVVGACQLVTRAAVLARHEVTQAGFVESHGRVIASVVMIAVADQRAARRVICLVI